MKPGYHAVSLRRQCPPGTLLGRLLPDVARATGLPSRVQVATGGHDHICGALAVGATDPDTLLNSLGTAEALCITSDRAWLSDQFARQGYTTGAHVARDRFYILGSIYTSGACVEWIRNLLGSNVKYGTLVSEAELAPPGSLGVHFQPHLRLGNPPNNDPESRAAFIGLTSDVKRGAMFRAVLEGLAYESRLCLEAIVSHPEIDRPNRIVAIGGNTRNRLLMQIKSSVFNQRISIADVEEIRRPGRRGTGRPRRGRFRGHRLRSARTDVRQLDGRAGRRTGRDLRDRISDRVPRNIPGASIPEP